MTPERWREVEDLYHLAVGYAPDQRVALLEGADPELRREVESLPAQEASKTGPLDRPPDPLGAVTARRPRLAFADLSRLDEAVIRRERVHCAAGKRSRTQLNALF